MAETGYSTLDTTVDKTNLILREIEQAYGWPKEQRNQSYHALRTVLHALRDRLSVDESAQFAAQLPTLVRGIYYEGWMPSRVPVKMDLDDVLLWIRQDFPFEVDGDVLGLMDTVLRALRRHVAEGEWSDIKSTLPKNLAAALP